MIKMPHSLRVAFLVLASAAVAGCTGTLNTAGSGSPTNAPTYHVGDRWVYNAEDGFRLKTTWEETHEIMAMGPDGVTVRISQKGPTTNVTRTEQWAAPVLVKVGAVYNNDTRRFVSPLEKLSFPLLVGKAWNQRAENTNEVTQVTGTINYYANVLGWESVTTPGGTYDALKIHVVMRLDDENYWRWATECNYTVWYAPSVGGAVKEQRLAQYLEKGDSLNAQVVRTQYANVQLVSFTPGRS
jgi:hypothetical protein